jgi:hypothetical protein
VASSSASERAYALIAAAIAWLGVLLQCYLSLKLSLEKDRTIGAGLVIFLGFFTVLTNIAVGLTLTLPLLARKSVLGQFLARPFAVAGVAASIAFVGLGYHFLLRHVWNPQGAQLLADITLHYVVPVIFVAYWWVYSRTGTLRWWHPLLWSLYPIAYFAYAVVRGEIIGTYPYGFIDVSAIGYRQTVQNAFGLLFAFILLGLSFVALDRIGRSANSRHS